MPWFPELSPPPPLAQHGANTPPIVPFYDGVLRMEPERLLASWAGRPNLDEPRAGHVEGADAFLEWVRQTRRWLLNADAAIRPVCVIVTPVRAVEEVVLELSLGGERRELPVAAVAERNPDGELTAIRVYHSLWPLVRSHEIRPPLLSRDPDLTVPDVVGDYQRALAAGDLEGVLATYEDDAVVREPAGGPYAYTGKENLRRIYTLMFVDGAGIPLELCAMTDDGQACALEYNVVRWGATALPPQAGVAVYQRGDSGRLAYGRIYDDVAPPAASDSSAPQGS
jgi:hypothetical protein